MSDSLEYSDVFKEDRGSMVPGKLKITGQNLSFRNSRTGKIEQINAKDIETMSWQRMGAGYGLRVIIRKSGHLFRFGGFNESDFDKLSKFFSSHYDQEFKEKELCLKGWNWGNCNFHGSVLSFDVADKHNTTAFEIPLTSVSQVAGQKQEVTLEFHQNDESGCVNLMEMRFYVPPGAEDEDPVKAFMQYVQEKASIIHATGESIVTFQELQCLTPRGRYDLKFYPTFIQLHGKTFDYKIPLDSVLRLFQLPHKDNRQVFFVISMDPPIKQGQTRYPFLVLLFNKEEDKTIELAMSEKDLQEKFEGKLQKEMTGPMYEIFGRVTKVLATRKITTPDPLVGINPAITCSYKANAGLLYPLDRGFIYVHKPAVHIRFDEILSVNFARSTGTTRSFDFEVETRVGVIHNFSSIEKEEYAKLFDFAHSKKLRIKNRGKEAGDGPLDDDMVGSDEDEDADPYLQRVTEEGRQRIDDDSDESDEDFAPDNLPSSEGESPLEEYDSDAISSSEEDEDGTKKKKKEKPKKSKSKEKKKKSKDNDGRPKKPMSAYFLWLNENRESLKKKYPDLGLTDLTKKAGEMWREKITDKSKWEKMAEDAKKKYAEEMAAYGGSSASSKSKSSKSKSSGESKKKSSSPSKSASPQKKVLSREFVEDSDSSDSDSNAKPASSSQSGGDKDKKEKESEKKKGKKKDKSESSEASEEESEEEESEEESSGSEDSD